MPLFLGLDCGGSSTRARVVDESGAIVFEGRSGPANFASTPIENLRAHLQEATKDAPEADSCAGCFAGMLTPNDALRAKAELQQLVKAKEHAVYPDYQAALASDPHAHTILISGTGCIIASEVDGKLVKSAGGGPLVGDQGSVFDLGRLALQNSLLSGRENEPSDLFRQTLTDQFGATDRDHVLAALYQTPSPAARVGKLAPAVVMDYHRRIPYARESVSTLIQRIADHLMAHHKAYGPFSSPWEIRLTGGLWSIEPDFLNLLTDTLSQRETELPELNVVILEIEPIEGAVNLAKKLKR